MLNTKRQAALPRGDSLQLPPPSPREGGSAPGGGGCRPPPPRSPPRRPAPLAFSAANSGTRRRRRRLLRGAEPAGTPPAGGALGTRPPRDPAAREGPGGGGRSAPCSTDPLPGCPGDGAATAAPGQSSVAGPRALTGCPQEDAALGLGARLGAAGGGYRGGRSPLSPAPTTAATRGALELALRDRGSGYPAPPGELGPGREEGDRCPPGVGGQRCQPGGSLPGAQPPRLIALPCPAAGHGSVSSVLLSSPLGLWEKAIKKKKKKH